MKLEIGKKYKVRDGEEVEYVEITRVYKGRLSYDFEGTVVHKSGHTLNDSYMSNGNYLASGEDSPLNIVEEYKEEVNEN